ncbi:hypothetical protein HHK36_012491 [Tetracentron sinense]|uniref:Uncharacterized protein n=1 Tax=Tetracentron sinense TaxID=13715 RepID=A0A834Z5W5_TETSI|nr:hypothetical protein HHK36_012491 [Tetracentron sinense]
METFACFTSTPREGHFSRLSSFTLYPLPKRPESPISICINPNFRSKGRSSLARPLQVSASSTIGAPNEGLEASSSGLVGENDLLIVGPGVLGRMVAIQWRQEYPGSQILGQTMTTDHHNELINIGINPFLRGSKAIHQFPNVIFCAPPSRTADYSGDVSLIDLACSHAPLEEESPQEFDLWCRLFVSKSNTSQTQDIDQEFESMCRLAASNWSGEGSLLFTSSSAPYDCNDNGSCDEDAASLSVAILKKKLRRQIFLGCDNHPLSRQEVMDLVNKSGKFSKKFEGFTGKLLLMFKKEKSKILLGGDGLSLYIDAVDGILLSSVSKSNTSQTQDIDQEFESMCRLSASNWSGEGSLLFTSSTAPYDCNDNGSCDEVLHL